MSQVQNPAPADTSDERALEATRVAFTPATSNAETWQAVAEAFKEALMAKNRVRDHLLGHPQVRAQGELRQKLRNIRKNTGYTIDTLATMFQADQTQLTEDDIDDLQDDIDLDTEEDEESFRRSRRIGAVLSTHTLPAGVMENLNQVRACFSLGLFPAAVIFCRAMVEGALYEAVKRSGALQGRGGTRGGTTDLAEWSLKELKRLATENRLRPPSSVWEPVFGDDQAAVGKLADHLLHSKRAPVPLSENDALRCIQASIDLLEALFSA